MPGMSPNLPGLGFEQWLVTGALESFIGPVFLQFFPKPPAPGLEWQLTMQDPAPSHCA